MLLPAAAPYSATLTVDNLTTTTIANLLLAPVSPADVTVSPNVVTGLALTPVPHSGGAGSRTQGVFDQRAGRLPGTDVCFNVSLHDQLFQECCSIEQCVTLPSCSANPSWGSVGGATPILFPDRVVLSGVGASGDDGARVEVGEAASFRLGWLPLDREGALPQGALVRMSATGSILGQPRELGSVEVRRSAGGLQLAADFSAIDSPTQRLEVYAGGQLVRSVSGHSGTVALRGGGNTIVIWPVAIGKIGGGSTSTCFAAEWDRTITFEIHGVGSFQGDELRVLAEHQEAPLDFIDSLTLQAARIPELTIIEAAGTYDCNHNDVDDALDIAGGFSSDVDADGVPDECRRPLGDPPSASAAIAAKPGHAP
ncbi:MAG: hypothetical protein HC897_20155 [Thermoanaerobaculia bacterium]|nr:hypothetical protein [Thermoanaerobaculia bacterium]